MAVGCCGLAGWNANGRNRRAAKLFSWNERPNRGSVKGFACFEKRAKTRSRSSACAAI